MIPQKFDENEAVTELLVSISQGYSKFVCVTDFSVFGRQIYSGEIVNFTDFVSRTVDSTEKSVF